MNRSFTDYRLPDGRIVPVDATAAKLEPIIGFQLKGGVIVDAIRADIATDEAARYGNLARVASDFYVATGNPAELTAATVYAKMAAHSIVREYVGEL